MWVWRRLRSATLCRASLRCGGARGAVCGRKLARSSQNGWRMAHYLEGKTTVDTNELSPKEATQMSYDVKYIGMDVHKEAIVIAVLNGTGKMIMETMLETKASASVQPNVGWKNRIYRPVSKITLTAGMVVFALLFVSSSKAQPKTEPEPI